MHAYLIIGTDANQTDQKITELVDVARAKALPFEIQKIEDVREFSKLARLSLSDKTAVIIKHFDAATHEAQNAFLKSLEEPQENITFILTCRGERGVLPTIASRCQNIFLKPELDKKANKIFSEFATLPVTQKLSYVDKIKDRGEAIEFVTSLFPGAHRRFTKLASNPTSIIITERTLRRLRANGNTSLQLANLAIFL